MRILITGAAGYVGSALAKFLLKRNIDVTLIDNFNTPSNLTDIEGVRINHVDIRDDLDLKSYDTIVHLAAISGIRVCEDNKPEAYDVNTRGTFNLLKKFKGRVIFASTSAVYGEAPEPIITEKSKVKPRSYYGITKFKSEALLELHGNSCVLRFSNIYGKGLMCKRTVSDLFIENSLRGLPLQIHGDGKQRRDFVHINDVIKSYWYAINSDTTGVFNIGGNESLNINEIANSVVSHYRDTFGTIPVIERIPIECGVVWKDFEYSSALAKDALGYEPSYKVVDEIRKRLVAYRRKNAPVS